MAVRMGEQRQPPWSCSPCCQLGDSIAAIGLALENMI